MGLSVRANRTEGGILPAVIEPTCPKSLLASTNAATENCAGSNRWCEAWFGVHLGDDLYGDRVNVTARLEGLAEAGGICISQQAFDQAETKLDLSYQDLEEQQVKNIARPVRAYRMRLDEVAAKAPRSVKPLK